MYLGESKLWHLYHLYRFDLSKDLVFDVMHIMGLNLFKNYTIIFFEDIGKHERKSDILDVVRSSCKSTTEARVGELKQSQWPRDPISHHETYTAEEYQKFVQWVLPIIVHKFKGRYLKERCTQGLYLVDIAHYFFNYSRSRGWTEHDLVVVHHLLQKWRTFSEELDGPNGKPLEHVAGAGHIIEDIRRFGHSDVYWCFPHEREIQKFTNMNTNQKNVEATFINYCSRKLFQKVNTCKFQEQDKLESSERALLEIHKSYWHSEQFVDNHDIDSICPSIHGNGCLRVSTKEKATAMMKLLKCPPMNTCAITATTKGIIISPLHNQPKEADPIISSYLRHLHPHLENNEKLYIYEHKRCLMGNVFYKVGDDVVVKHDNAFGTPFKGNITQFFAHEFQGFIQVYFSAKYYEQIKVSSNGQETNLVDEFTGMNFIKNNKFVPFDDTCIRPMSCIMHKFMCIKNSRLGKTKNLAYEMQDTIKRDRLVR